MTPSAKLKQLWDARIAVIERERDEARARLAAAEAERDALADTCVEAADQIDTLRGLLREDLAGIGHTADWWKRLNKALEGKP